MPQICRLLRRGLVPLLAALCVVVAAPDAGAQAGELADETAAGTDLEALDVSFRPTNDLERWFGGDVDGELHVTIVNTGDRPIAASAGTARVGERTVWLPPVELAPGERTRVVTDLTIGGMSFAERDVIVEVGDTTLVTSHRTIPWILVALAAFALNAALLAGRDQLRAAVRRRIAEPAGSLGQPAA